MNFLPKIKDVDFALHMVIALAFLSPVLLIAIR